MATSASTATCCGPAPFATMWASRMSSAREPGALAGQCCRRRLSGHPPLRLWRTHLPHRGPAGGCGPHSRRAFRRRGTDSTQPGKHARPPCRLRLLACSRAGGSARRTGIIQCNEPQRQSNAAVSRTISIRYLMVVCSSSQDARGWSIMLTYAASLTVAGMRLSWTAAEHLHQALIIIGRAPAASLRRKPRA